MPLKVGAKQKKLRQIFRITVVALSPTRSDPAYSHLVQPMTSSLSCIGCLGRQIAIELPDVYVGLFRLLRAGWALSVRGLLTKSGAVVRNQLASTCHADLDLNKRTEEGDEDTNNPEALHAPSSGLDNDVMELTACAETARSYGTRPS